MGRSSSASTQWRSPPKVGLLALGFDERVVEQGIDGAAVWGSGDGGSTWFDLAPARRPDAGASLVGKQTGWFAFGSEISVTSDDGITWQENFAPLPAGVANVISYADTAYIGIDGDQRRFWRSADVGEWHLEPDFGLLPEAQRVESIQRFGGDFVAVGLGGSQDEHRAVAGLILSPETPTPVGGGNRVAEGCGDIRNAADELPLG